ncbi:hypothetical protein ABI59_06735 [Acidobacteria bacterium Mor1]|nr:hypothetical protein ABI59_06735 [Acidobacteria bacterium Mor1]
MTESNPNYSGSARISVLDPLSQALDWTVRVLFGPIDPVKWLTLGFCAWLAWLGRGGGFSTGTRYTRDDGDWSFARGWDSFMSEYGVLFVTFIAIIVFIAVCVSILLLYLSSRGMFMFIDGVRHNRGDVVAPWRRFGSAALSLFLFRLCIVLAGVALFSALGMTLLLGGVGASALGAEDPEPAWLMLLVLWLPVVLIAAVVWLVLSVVINDFVAPLMWLRNCRALEAWGALLGLVRIAPGSFLLYLLLKMFIFVALTLIGCMLVCVTCCIAALPYIGTVLMLPLFVFRRAYSLYFLSQFGGDLAELAPREDLPAPPPPAPPAAGGPGAAEATA